MPSGQVEEGESIILAAIREVKEENSIDMGIAKFCGVFHNATDGVCNIDYGLVRKLSGDLSASEECVKVSFFSIEDVLQLVTWKNSTDRIRRYLD